MKEKDALDLIMQLKIFAETRLGITPNDSFTEMLDPKVEKLFVLYASRDDRLSSMIGGSPYCERHSDKDECEMSRRELARMGADTYVREISAYGGVDCPITPLLLKSSISRIAEVVLHEQSHIEHHRKEVKLRLDLEEAVAMTFSYQGSLIFFNERNKKVLQHVHRWMKFYCEREAFMNKYIAKLNKAYEDDFGRGREVLNKAKREAKKKGWSYKDMNNAYFLMQSFYSRSLTPVYKALKGIHPRDYTTNKRLLYQRLKHLR